MNVQRRRWLVATGIIVTVLVALIATGLWLWTPASEQEAARLVARLGIQPGMTVGEIGAGSGTMALAIARSVGPEGHVYANELSTSRLAEIRQAVADEGLANVTVIEGEVDRTNLPDRCCDVVFMRHVYHHFTEDSLNAILASVYASLKPGGTLGVIDFPPSRILGAILGHPDGVSEDRLGHGIAVDVLVKEVAGVGFTPVKTVDGWLGRSYLVVFSRPPEEAARTPVVGRNASR